MVLGACMTDFLVIANWKMGGDKALVADYQALSMRQASNVKVVVCLPSPYLGLWSATSSMELAAQNVDIADGGSLTGGVSAKMLRMMGCRYVLVGHSERRIKCLESDSLVASKYVEAYKCSLLPVYCVGESLSDRAGGSTKAVLEAQMSALFNTSGFADLQKHDIIIAYEPVWAIGGKVAATLDDVANACEFLQSIASQAGCSVTILYGGSVHADNCLSFRSCGFLHGLLVGRACLDMLSFERIIEQCNGF